ncbi:M-phase inducer phosphatase-like isoform X2 [Lycorma delicatula]|uniref:M-phase inducer phosphatase-like isoform X2 n=1 Tax=Lycorma delicatula TaxID=130591 RepID=UPI003F50DA8F
MYSGVIKDSVCEVCQCCSRLIKNALKVTTTPVGVSRRGVARRLSQLNRDHDRDENQPPSAITSPNKSLTSPSKFAAMRQLSRPRTPLEDHDPNSQDSGISEDSNKSSFRFAAPSGLAPRKPSNTDFSPKRLLTANSNSGSASGLSQCSMESIDDGFMELIHQDKMLEDENAQLPSGMSSLLMQPILRNENERPSTKRDSPSPHRATFRRWFSENLTNKTSQVEEFSLKMKRPAVRPSDSPQSKRHRPLAENCSSNTPQRKQAQRTLFDHGFMKKTLSPKTKCITSEATIKNALSRSSKEELIGDFSKPFALPLTKGAHQDLKNISSETLADLVRGKYDHEIASYQIIDCRYPYEYEGGHIKGAKNIYTKDQLDKEFMESRPKWDSSSDKRNVLIFHCEFSSERGPTLSRFLRQRDRDNNSDLYPTLDYPEIYLLNGGYKAFYQNYSELCEPCAYLKMTDPKHEEDLKLFRSKAKTWAGDRKYGKFSKRPSFMRLT